MIVAPGTSFDILPDPGQLVIPSGTNSVTLVNLHRDHAEAAREFKEWVNLECAEKKKIVEVIAIGDSPIFG